MANSGTANGTQIWQYTCNNTNSQRFKVADVDIDVGDGRVEILSVPSNRAWTSIRSPARRAAPSCRSGAATDRPGSAS